MNLKKLTLWKKKRGMLPPAAPAFHAFLDTIFKIFTFKKTPLLGYVSYKRCLSIICITPEG
jgi:hypothetical protein